MMLDNVLIYNPNCSKSRLALEIVESKGIECEMRNYVERPLSKAEVTELLRILGKSPFDIVRKKESDFTENSLASANEEELISAIEKFPMILERPIAIINGKGIMARPPELIEEIV